MYNIRPDSILRVDFPMPPSVNHYWGQRVHKGRVTRYIDKRGKQFREDVAECLKGHLEHCRKNFIKGTRLSVCVLIAPPDRRRRDIDNLCKALLDAMEHAGAYPDDSMIDVLTLIRNPDDIVEGGRVRVIISVLDNDTKEED